MNTDLIILGLMTARNEKLLSEDPGARDEHGWTPLHAAVAYGKLCKVEALLEKDNDKTLLNASNYDGWTPLHVAAALNGNPIAAGLSLDIDNEKDSQLAVLEHLINKGADRKALNKDRWTPLHVAAAVNHNAEVVRKLMNGPGVPAPGVKDGKGRTPLHMAAANNNNPRVMEQLLSVPGVDMNKRTDDCSTPLHWAAARAMNPAVVTVLLSRGANLNARNKAGCTPLHRAAKKNMNPKIVELLLDHGADPRLKNEKGQLPVDLADKNKRVRGTEAYWQLHAAKYLPHEKWNGTSATRVQNQNGGSKNSGKDDGEANDKDPARRVQEDLK